jgi:hypothetical protein
MSIAPPPNPVSEIPLIVDPPHIFIPVAPAPADDPSICTSGRPA